MSWDIFIFKANCEVKDIDDIEEKLLVNIGTWQEFKLLLLAQFPQASFDGSWCTIEVEHASLETSLGPPNEKMSNTIFHLYGTDALHPLLYLCQQNNWQAFDTALGSMLNPDKTERNGYSNFAAYLAQIRQNG
ncbi:MAG: hypothetical protein EOO60_11605 [Hymenobacter sp.]|nr:MAG: hypothetical protein EOO60_11605 [Hymenobacter sp.]